MGAMLAFSRAIPAIAHGLLEEETDRLEAYLEQELEKALRKGEGT